MTKLEKTVAENIKKHRVRTKQSQKKVAEKAHLSVSFVSMLERGQRSPPLSTLEKIAGALGVAPTTLLS